MQLLGLFFFLAALFLSMGIIVQLLVADRHRILEALLGEAREPNASPPAQIYHFPVRGRRQVEWRQAA